MLCIYITSKQAKQKRTLQSISQTMHPMHAVTVVLFEWHEFSGVDVPHHRNHMIAPGADCSRWDGGCRRRRCRRRRRRLRSRRYRGLLGRLTFFRLGFVRLPVCRILKETLEMCHSPVGQGQMPHGKRFACALTFAVIRKLVTIPLLIGPSFQHLTY